MSGWLFMLILCLDSFFASVSFTVSRIKCFKGMSLVIAAIGSLFLWIAFQFASVVMVFLPHPSLVSGILLILIGSLSLGKRFIAIHQNEVFRLRLKQVHILLEIVKDETKADFDQSKSLNLHEVLYLAVALSLDSLASGFAFGLSLTLTPYFFILLFLFNVLAVESGLWMGRWFSTFSQKDVSWVCGLFLILLGISRLTI